MKCNPRVTTGSGVTFFATTAVWHRRCCNTIRDQLPTKRHADLDIQCRFFENSSVDQIWKKCNPRIWISRKRKPRLNLPRKCTPGCVPLRDRHCYQDFHEIGRHKWDSWVSVIFEVPKSRRWPAGSAQLCGVCRFGCLLEWKCLLIPNQANKCNRVTAYTSRCLENKSVS